MDALRLAVIKQLHLTDVNATVSLQVLNSILAANDESKLLDISSLLTQIQQESNYIQHLKIQLLADG